MELLLIKEDSAILVVSVLLVGLGLIGVGKLVLRGFGLSISRLGLQGYVLVASEGCKEPLTSTRAHAAVLALAVLLTSLG
jgi:hypothetical protein